MATTSVRNILLALEENWFSSGNEHAIKVAHLLKSALAGVEVKEVDIAQNCDPPTGLCLESPDKEDQVLIQALYHSWNGLGWTIAHHFELDSDSDKIKEARLIGPKGPIISDQIDVKISYVSPNTLVPRHSEEAAELLQILEGDQIQVGYAVDDWMDKQKYNHFPSTHPKVVKTADNHFVAVSVHYGKIGGRVWLNDAAGLASVGSKYLDITDIERNSTEKYYDNVAEDYAKAMTAWGYCMPQLLTEALLEHGGLETPYADVKIVDLGCGDGAVGLALHEKGFTNLTGVDISNGMMKIAEEKGIYSQLQKADLLQKLPFEDDTFDCAVTSAVTTYLDNSALAVWLPIVKKGGIFCIVHKASVWPKWEGEQDRLQRANAWKLVWNTKDPLPYLPSLGDKGTTKAKIYIYQKL